jgi:hypothetical protein
MYADTGARNPTVEIAWDFNSKKIDILGEKNSYVSNKPPTSLE